MNISLCKTCEHCMSIEIENEPGGSGNRQKVICLKLPKIFSGLVLGHYKETDPYPRVIKCNKHITGRFYNKGV